VTQESAIGCTIHSLPDEELIPAARTAVAENPVNAPSGLVEPQRIALLTTKYWGAGGTALTVQFLDGPDTETQRLVLQHMNRWGQHSGFRFRATRSTGHVRIARENDGYWSYLGTDILHIPHGQQTMNLQGFTAATPESEYRRVVCHEAGHTMGFPHEHMRREIVSRLDVEKTVAYFTRTQGWSRQEVINQVLTSLEDSALTVGPVQETSIMCYQLPGSITKDGRPIPGGTRITAADDAFARKVYPPIAPG
jgi:hypothetical protein